MINGENGRGAIYSVEEVSDLLGIPRPTLYRYLREYSVPHFRKSGRIRIPEDSVELLRRARDLHREGLGTGSVRMRLREAATEAPDTGELALRIDRLSKELEGLKSDPKALDEASSPHALRTILARQSLLMSAVFNLTEMVEGLVRANGAQTRREPFEEAELRGEAVRPDEPETRLARSRTVEKSIRLSSPEPSASAGRAREFGSLAKRRRRGALAALVALFVCATLTWLLATTNLAQAFGGLLPGDEQRGETGSEVAAASTRVPDLSGLTYDEAKDRLEEVRLGIKGQNRDGEIADQSPRAGAEISPGEKVAVTLETGDEPPDRNEADDASSAGASQYGEDLFEYTE